MPRDYLNQPPTTMRRSDRSVEDEAWIKKMLHAAPVGTMATAYEGQPFINTNFFYYDEEANCIFIHTARKGRTRATVEANPSVCFSVMEMGRLLPAPVALEFSTEYAGVTVFGEASVVNDEDEATVALQKLLDKYVPHLTAGEDYRPPVLEELARTTVMQITINSWSGKKKEVDADFEGAYWYESQPMLKSVRDSNNNEK